MVEILHYCPRILLNIDMKQFKATVRVGGLIVATIVFAENSSCAMRLLRAQFGASNVVGNPMAL